MDPPKAKFPSWAVAVIIIGVAGFCCCGGAIVVLPVLAQARQAARATGCMSRLGDLSASLLIYAEQNDETLPEANAWQDIAEPPGTSLIACPSLADPPPSGGYAMNLAMNRAKVPAIKRVSNVVLLFESDLEDRNSAGDPSQMPEIARHSYHGERGSFVVDLNGKARLIPGGRAR